MSAKDLSLSELQFDDADALSMLMRDNQTRFQRDFPLTLAQNLTKADSKAYIGRKQIENASKTEFTWAIREKTSNVVAGLVILKELDWEKESGEFAYCIGAKYEGRGWVTAAIKELSAFAFENLGLQRLQIIAHETNLASLRVAEKNGYTWQKKLLKSYTPPGSEALDMELFEKYCN